MNRFSMISASCSLVVLALSPSQSGEDPSLPVTYLWWSFFAAAIVTGVVGAGLALSRPDVSSERRVVAVAIAVPPVCAAILIGLLVLALAVGGSS